METITIQNTGQNRAHTGGAQTGGERGGSDSQPDISSGDHIVLPITFPRFQSSTTLPRVMNVEPVGLLVSVGFRFGNYHEFLWDGRIPFMR
jgi:hypothetical protein